MVLLHDTYFNFIYAFMYFQVSVQIQSFPSTFAFSPPHPNKYLFEFRRNPISPPPFHQTTAITAAAEPEDGTQQRASKRHFPAAADTCRRFRRRRCSLSTWVITWGWTKAPPSTRSSSPTGSPSMKSWSPNIIINTTFDIREVQGVHLWFFLNFSFYFSELCKICLWSLCHLSVRLINAETKGNKNTVKI